MKLPNNISTTHSKTVMPVGLGQFQNAVFTVCSLEDDIKTELYRVSGLYYKSIASVLS